MFLCSMNFIVVQHDFGCHCCVIRCRVLQPIAGETMLHSLLERRSMARCLSLMELIAEAKKELHHRDGHFIDTPERLFGFVAFLTLVQPRCTKCVESWHMFFTLSGSIPGISS